MGNSVLVFVSHASGDKTEYIDPIVEDLESCYINVWIDKRKILPGSNIRRSIFREGLDKADVVLLFFTEKALQSAWVDTEIKHVLREEKKKGNDFDLKKVITIFDTNSTYDAVADRYPELTDDLLHLMPIGYDKIALGQLLSAIWSKYSELQGGDVATQRQLLSRDREILKKESVIKELEKKLETIQEKELDVSLNFDKLARMEMLKGFIQNADYVLTNPSFSPERVEGSAAARALGLLQMAGSYFTLTKKGEDFLRWLMLREIDK